MYRDFIAWLDGSWLSQLFKVTAWLVPTVQSIHILAIGVVLSAAAIIALRLAGVRGRHVSVGALAERLMPPMWWALGVLLASGAILITAEPLRTLLNPYFFAKMAFLLVLIPLAGGFQIAVRRRPDRWTGAFAPSRIASPVAAAAMLLLIAVIFCGRWIAYA